MFFQLSLTVFLLLSAQESRYELMRKIGQPLQTYGHLEPCNYKKVEERKTEERKSRTFRVAEKVGKTNIKICIKMEKEAH